MNCPQCQYKARRLSGGYKHIGTTTRIAYWYCDDCETKFSVVGHTVKILSDELGQSFKSTREALKVLRLTARDDRLWFNEVSEDTLTLARQVVALISNR